jgi:hypothetical protein
MSWEKCYWQTESQGVCKDVNTRREQRNKALEGYQTATGDQTNIEKREK